VSRRCHTKNVARHRNSRQPSCADYPERARRYQPNSTARTPGQGLLTDRHTIWKSMRPFSDGNGVPGLAFRRLLKEPLVVILPSDHVSLHSRPSVRRIWSARHSWPCSEHSSRTACGHRQLSEALGVNITPTPGGSPLYGSVLIASTRGVGLLPAYAQNFLPSSVTSGSSQGRHADYRAGPRYKK